MLKAIIVDDEKLAIEYLERCLIQIEKVDIVGKFTNSNVALSEIEKVKPDIIFLDINMPGINGIELAKKVKAMLSHCRIVFVTAYKEHAVKAFEVGAEGYILKPYEKCKIAQLIDRILGSRYKRVSKDNYAVCGFRSFHFKKNGKEIKDVKWRTSKAKELFAYLVQHHRKIVRKDVLIDLLWPDMNHKNAYDNLYSAIYHIRNTLKVIGVNIDISSTVHGYEISFNDVTYDVLEWENKVKQLGAVTEANFSEYEEVMKLYKDNYLAEETFVWKENEQERLRILFHFKIREMIDYLMQKKQYKSAALYALKIQGLNPYLDYSYFMLMQIYDSFGDKYSVERQYSKLKQIYEEEFNSLPDKQIRTWYQGWLKGQLAE